MANAGNENIGEYTTTGGTVGSGTLISGNNLNPWGVAVIPEPSTWAMLIAGAGLLLAFRRRDKA